MHIKETTTAKDLWDKLKQLFDDSGFTRKISLLRNLIPMRLENFDKMTSYVNKLVETAQSLRDTGFNIDDEWIGSLLLAGLPEKFSPMIMAIKHSGIKITTDSIKTKLLDMDGDIGNTGSAFISKAYSNERRTIGNTSVQGRNGSPANGNVKRELKDVKLPMQTIRSFQE